ncbi:MAG: hypothetical protein WCX69_01105, partial [Candidatus Paceibacterota bacterium]
MNLNAMFQDTLDYIVDRFSGTAFDLVSAAVICLFGWYFAYAIGNKAAEVFSRSRLNQAIKRLGWDDPVSRVYRGGSVADFFGKVVEVWILLFFLMVGAGILQLAQLGQLIGSAVAYFFNIFAAFLILAVAVFLVDFSQRKLSVFLEKEKFAYSRFIMKLSSGTTWTLTILAVLYQLKIVAPLVLAVFIGIVLMISLAVGV